MYYCVKNCYCIWSFALGGCPLEEESEDNSPLLKTSYFSLGLSIFSCVHICNFSKSYGLSTLEVVPYLFLRPQRISFLGFLEKKGGEQNSGHFLKKNCAKFEEKSDIFGFLSQKYLTSKNKFVSNGV
jgi:hypothetical protein